MEIMPYIKVSSGLFKFFKSKLHCIAVFICFFSVINLKGQVCGGSLGDPVINQTFGSSGYSLPAGSTSYTFVGGCPNAMGTYTLSGFLFGCGPRSWVQMVGDHTPNDNNGNYMLVNAWNTPGKVYTDTARSLCANTVYQFGMWVTPVMTSFACNGTPILPNIVYTVKTPAGAILIQDSTGYLPIVQDRDWKYYGKSLTMPSNASDLIILITVNPPFGCGAAFAIDDVTLTPCSPSTISATLNGAVGPVDVCADYTDTWLLNANYTPGFNNPVVQWQTSTNAGVTWTDIPGETTLSYLVPHRTSGVILYRVCIAENGNINSLSCRISSNIIHTGVYPVPAPVAPLNVKGCIGKNFSFPPGDPSALEFLWTGPNAYNSINATAVIPNVQYSDTGMYKLKLTFYYGCVLYDTFYLKVFPGTTVSVQPSYPICEGQSETLIASATDSVGFVWSPSTGLSSSTVANPIASPRDSIDYKVVTTNRYGCQDSAYMQVDVYRNPVANAGADKSILLGDTVFLNGSVKGTSVNYFWTPSTTIDNTGILNPRVFPAQTMTYTLHVVSGVGCGSKTDDAQVKVFNDFYIPNAFTPNNDGINDKFHIIALGSHKLKSFSIYNRWGEVVYKAEGKFDGWDGTFHKLAQPSDIYIYYLEIEMPTGGTVTRKGTVLLIR
jgi:gliding motility-associated-like protein